MRNRLAIALAAGIIGVVAPVVGTWIVLRRMANLGDTMSHGTLAGVAIAYAAGANILLGALAHDNRLDADIYGAGPEFAALVALADELGLTSRVTFRGHVDEALLPAVFPTFDVLAVPSLPIPGWLEQFGRVVVEAQASGVPAVASASGALPEVVGRAGILVPPGDSKALAAALVRLLDEPGLWHRVRSEATQSVGRYSWESVAALQGALY